MGIKNSFIEATVEEDNNSSDKFETWTIPQILDFISDGKQQEKVVFFQEKIILSQRLELFDFVLNNSNFLIRLRHLCNTTYEMNLTPLEL